MSPPTTPASPVFDALVSAAQSEPPLVAIVLGSGLAAVARSVTEISAVRFVEVPGLPPPTVHGHPGRLVLGEWKGRSVLIWEGRIHQYEGHSWRDVTLPVQTAARLGARCMILTNAAGGISDNLQPGALMAIRAQLDWTQPRFWLSQESRTPYSPRLLNSLHEAARQSAIELHEGIYAAMLGPNYETPAEIRALASRGADAVGMSTTREAEAAQECGMECLGISCITNRAAGLCQGGVNHQEVLTTAATLAQRLAILVEGLLARLG